MIEKMPYNSVYWRCKCGEEHNLPDSLDCRNCNKQRWQNLGLTREQAEGLLGNLFPASLE